MTLIYNRWFAPFTKKNINFRNIEKGYECLREDGIIQVVHDLKLKIMLKEKSQINSMTDTKISKFLTLKDLALYDSQTISLYLFEGPSLVRALSIAKLSNKPLFFPLKKEWKIEFIKSGIQVNKMICGLMWYLLLSMKLYKNTIICCRLLLNSNKSENVSFFPTEIKKRRGVYFPGAQKNHLINQSTKIKQRNFANWLSDLEFPKDNLHIYHDLQNSQIPSSEYMKITSSVFESDLQNGPGLNSFNQRVSRFLFLIIKAPKLKSKLFILLRNMGQVYIALKHEKIISSVNLDLIIFDCSNFIIKPLWAVVAEKKGNKVVFCFYSISAEPQFHDGTQVRDGLWILSNWNEFWVNDLTQISMLSSLISNKNVFFKVIGIPDWVDSGIEFNRPKKPFILLFDNEPHENSISLASTYLFEFYSKDSIFNFFETVLLAAEKLDFLVVHKTKRAIGDKRTEGYTEILSRLENRYPNNYVRIDDSIAPIRIIMESCAVISSPISTTAVIAKNCGVPSVYLDLKNKLSSSDPALRGVKSIRSLLELTNWLSELKLYDE
jgi:polysaccharide biosynthesis PFTS motif protein